MGKAYSVASMGPITPSDRRHNFIICWTGAQREHLLAAAPQLQSVWHTCCGISATASLYIRFRQMQRLVGNTACVIYDGVASPL